MCECNSLFKKFSVEFLKYWQATQYKGLNIYILCDPANEKRKRSDYTVFIVVGGVITGFYTATEAAAIAALYAFVVTFRHAFSVFNILFYLIYLFVPETRGAF